MAVMQWLEGKSVTNWVSVAKGWDKQIFNKLQNEYIVMSFNRNILTLIFLIPDLLLGN